MDQQNVKKYLSGCDFPCGTTEIEQAAQDNRAPQDIIQNLRSLPDRQYRDASDVQKELKQVATPSSR